MTRAAVLLLVLAACSSKSEPPPSATPPPTAPTPGPASGSMTTAPVRPPATEARRIFGARCSTCHGTGGRGDGMAARSMKPPPRDYTDPAWQASVTDAELTRIIVLGGAAVGKNSMMPAAADLTDKPEIVAELVKIIRGFNGTAPAPVAPTPAP